MEEIGCCNLRDTNCNKVFVGRTHGFSESKQSRRLFKGSVAVVLCDNHDSLQANVKKMLSHSLSN